MITMIPAIAFIPTEDIVVAWEILQEHTEDMGFQSVLDYFEDTYIGRLRRNRTRRNPRYPHATWNLYELVLSGEPRTNNGIEAFNNQLSRSVAASHPTIWKLIDTLKSEYIMAEQRIEAFQAGGNAPQRSQTYVNLSDRIQKVVQRYDQMTTLDYLRSISHNLRLG